MINRAFHDRNGGHAITSVSIHYKSAHPFGGIVPQETLPAKRWGIRIIGRAARHNLCSRRHMSHICGRDRSRVLFALYRSASGTTYRMRQGVSELHGNADPFAAGAQGKPERPGYRTSRTEGFIVGDQATHGQPHADGPVRVEPKMGHGAPRGVSAPPMGSGAAGLDDDAGRVRSVRASQSQGLAFARDSGEILVDEARWIVGDVRGAPCTKSGTNVARLPRLSVSC